jgi:hypothetical protein
MYYVLVAGTGETSRANIEALMEDYYYANGDDGVLVLSYKDAPSKSQIYAAQYAVDCKKDIMVFCREDAKTSGIPRASITFADFPIVAATDYIKDQDGIAQILWNEEDTNEDIEIVQQCTDKKIRAYNLCDGLVPLSVIEKTVQEPITEAVAPKVIETPKIEQNAEVFKQDLLKTAQGIQSMLDLLVKKING